MTVTKPLIVIVATAMLLIAGDVWTMPPVAQATPQAIDADHDGGITFFERITKEAITSLGPLGILWWYLYHTQTKRMPEKDKQITDAIAGFDKSVQDLMAAHAKVVSEIMTEHRQANERSNTTILEIVRKCPGAKLPT